MAGGSYSKRQKSYKTIVIIISERYSLRGGRWQVSDAPQEKNFFSGRHMIEGGGWQVAETLQAKNPIRELLFSQKNFL